MPLTPLIHVTAAYSNAVLVAILPHISDYAKKLDLPISQSITMNQVVHSGISRMTSDFGGSIWLTNGYWFDFGNGCVRGFRNDKNDPFTDQDPVTNWPKYAFGKDNMTTNEAIQFARRSFQKLGYKLADFHLDAPPASMEGPYDLKDGNHVPYCRIKWDSPSSPIWNVLGLTYDIEFTVDLQRKQLVGLTLIGRPFQRPNPQISVKPELERDYQARVNGKKIHVPLQAKLTPAYSNATLAATSPYISAFAKKLNLPVTLPLTPAQIMFYTPPDYPTNYFSCHLMLTNHYWFSFTAGCVYKFTSPDNWFEEKETRTDWPLYSRKDCLTTNEAINFARDCLRKLGYKPEDFHAARPPTTFDMAIDKEQYAYCQIDWDSPEMQGVTDEYHLEFDINLKEKKLVGMLLMDQHFFKTNPFAGIIPEVESDDQKQVRQPMTLNTNAPRRLQPRQALLPKVETDLPPP